MEVYIAFRTEGEEWSASVLGVYSTRTAAQAECDKHDYGYCYVQEHMLETKAKLK